MSVFCLKKKKQTNKKTKNKNKKNLNLYFNREKIDKKQTHKKTMKCHLCGNSIAHAHFF